MSENITMEQIEKLLKDKKKAKRRMKTGKKALYSAYFICAILIAFTMLMIYQGKDTTTLAILATAGVGSLPIMYKIYYQYNTEITLKNMEMNYIENYDEQEGIY